MDTKRHRINDDAITPEMIEAGVRAYGTAGTDDQREMVRAIFAAMLEASGATITTELIVPRTLSANSWDAKK